MKIQTTILLAAVCVSGLLLSPPRNRRPAAPTRTPSPRRKTAAPPEMTPAPNPAPAEAAPEANQPVESTVILPKANAPEAVASPFAPPAQAVGTNNSNALLLNFRNAPLEMVLNYLSDAAGFIIVQDTHVNGTVTIIEHASSNAGRGGEFAQHRVEPE